MLSSERKKLQKAALGLVDSDDDDPNEDVRLGLLIVFMLK